MIATEQWQWYNWSIRKADYSLRVQTYAGRLVAFIQRCVLSYIDNDIMQVKFAKGDLMY